jgi:uncharacterized protein YbjT (DUF2867 family)
MSLLVIGGTGTLGRQIVRRAVRQGYQVKCFTRNFRRANFLKDWGAELVYGDLSLPETIPPALKGVSFVIDAATVRPTDDYTCETIDWKGKIALIEASKLAKIKKFIFFSILGASENSSIPLIDLKLKITKKLQNVPFACTVFHCSGFYQGLINQYAVPLLENKTIWLMNGSARIAHIDTRDAAIPVLDNLKDLEIGTQNLAIIGERFWSSEEILTLCEIISAKDAKTIYIPSIILSVLSRFLRFFEFTWNISDRLQFSELSIDVLYTKQNIKEVTWTSERLPLKRYMLAYFVKIQSVLRETNYKKG